MKLMMKTKMTRLLAVLILLAGVQACAQNSAVDIGNNGATGASLVDYVDQWDGYTEAQQFVFGSDRVRLSLTDNGQGTLVLGESQVYPAATDPNVGYPPGEDTMSVIVKESMFRAGFEYPVHGVKVESSRIRFTVSTTDFFKKWCELQTPVASQSPPVYFCGPDTYRGTADDMCFGQTDPPGGMETPINCAKAALCIGNRVCSCTATACTSNGDSGIQFDAALREQGTLLEGTFNNATVRMQRK